jgi:hypothetical protein
MLHPASDPNGLARHYLDKPISKTPRFVKQNQAGVLIKQGHRYRAFQKGRNQWALS